jgi:hypothetical protein
MVTAIEGGRAGAQDTGPGARPVAFAGHAGRWRSRCQDRNVASLPPPIGAVDPTPVSVAAAEARRNGRR